MIRWDIVNNWYKIVSEKFPDMSEDDRVRLALAIYHELDYIVLMGILRPGGLFEKLGIPQPKNEPAGIANFDYLKYLK